MATLIKLSEFIQIIGNSTLHESYEKDLSEIYNYTTFLRKNIFLGDFVGENAIFKRFTIKDNDGWKTLLYEDRYYKSFPNFSDAFGKETIEDFIPHNFEVTDTIQQQFNL